MKPQVKKCHESFKQTVKGAELCLSFIGLSPSTASFHTTPDRLDRRPGLGNQIWPRPGDVGQRRFADGVPSKKSSCVEFCPWLLEYKISLSISTGNAESPFSCIAKLGRALPYGTRVCMLTKSQKKQFRTRANHLYTKHGQLFCICSDLTICSLQT